MSVLLIVVTNISCQMSQIFQNPFAYNIMPGGVCMLSAVNLCIVLLTIQYRQYIYSTHYYIITIKSL